MGGGALSPSSPFSLITPQVMPSSADCVHELCADMLLFLLFIAADRCISERIVHVMPLLSVCSNIIEKNDENGEQILSHILKTTFNLQSLRNVL